MRKFLKITGLILVSLVLLYLIWGAFWLWYRSAEDEVHIIPNNFQGCVIILFEEKNGHSKEYNKEGKRIYRIPQNGILKTKFKKEDGWRDVNYIRKNGEKIRYLLPSDRVWQDTINVNSPYKDSLYVYLARHSNDTWYIVGKPKDIGKWNKEMKEKWEPYSETKTLREGESTGKVRHNKLFDE